MTLGIYLLSHLFLLFIIIIYYYLIYFPFLCIISVALQCPSGHRDLAESLLLTFFLFYPRR